MMALGMIVMTFCSYASNWWLLLLLWDFTHNTTIAHTLRNGHASATHRTTHMPHSSKMMI
jgi:hypothetical protein